MRPEQAVRAYLIRAYVMIPKDNQFDHIRSLVYDLSVKILYIGFKLKFTNRGGQ